MGKRSRKRTPRGGAPEWRQAGSPSAPSAKSPQPPRAGAARPPRATAARPQPAYASTPDRRARLSEAPKAPWAPFPLVELCILLGLIAIVLGLLDVAGRRGLLLIAGFALISVAAVELAVREHFAGFRSHSALLAGIVAVLVDVPLFLLTSIPQEVLLIVGAAVFGVGFQGLRQVFARKTGGLGFRA